MEIATPRLLLRTWRRGDEDALVRNIDHHAVWRNVGDSIPHPYTRADAEAFLALVEKDERSWHLAIVANGDAVGSIGMYRFDGRSKLVATVHTDTVQARLDAVESLLTRLRPGAGVQAGASARS